MAIAFVAGTAGAQTGVTLTFSHTVSAGSDRILAVGISNSHTGRVHNSCTYGGVSMTKQLSVYFAGDTSDEVMSIWTLVAPAVGTANVVASISGSSIGHAVYGVAGSFTGVHQTTSIGTTNKDETTPGTSVSAAIAGASGDMALWFAHAVNGTSHTFGSGQTVIAQSNVGGSRNSSGSYELMSGTSETMSASGWASVSQFGGGFALKPASGASPNRRRLSTVI